MNHGHDGLKTDVMQDAPTRPYSTIRVTGVRTQMRLWDEHSDEDVTSAVMSSVRTSVLVWRQPARIAHALPSHPRLSGSVHDRNVHL